MLNELKKFVKRGNVLDLAVGVIIGTAFSAIIGSLVNDIIMPPIGLLLKNVNFTDLFISLDGNSYASLEAAKTAGAPTLNYGVFINSVLNFLIIAVVVFLIVRAANRMFERPEEAPSAPETKTCPYCKTAIPVEASRCPHCTSQLEM